MLLDMAAIDPAPVILILGDEELLADRAVSEVIAAVRAADPTAEVHDLPGAKVELGELTRMTSPSLFGDRSVVVIRSAQDLVKDVIAEVVAYAAHPAEETVLVLVHPGGVKGKALVDGVKKAGAQVVTVTKVTKPAERLAFVKAEVKRAGRHHRRRRRRGAARRRGQRSAGARRRLQPARLRHPGQDDRRGRRGPLSPGPGRGQRVHRGRLGRRGPAGRGPGAAALGAGHRERLRSCW